MQFELPHYPHEEPSQQNEDDCQDYEDEEMIEQHNNEQEKLFVSRTQIIRNLKFPKSSSSRVIVLPNNEGLGFRLDGYNNAILSDRMDESEFKHTVYELSKACSLEFGKKLHREKTDPFLNEKRMLLYNIPILMLAILLFSLRVFDAVINSYIFEIGVAFLGIDILAVVINFIRSQVKKPDLTSFTEATYNTLSIKLQEINAVFLSRKVTWKLHPKIFWVEIILA